MKKDKKIRKVAKKYGFVTLCSGGCGMPIRKEQVAINDTVFTHDYTEHCDIQIDLVFCTECLERVKSNARGGMEKAILKYEESLRNE